MMLDRDIRLPARRLKFRLRIALGIMLAASMACTIPGLPRSSPEPTPAASGIAPAPATTPELDLPPALVETQPLPGARISIQTGITLTFNQAMDRNSVEAALQAEPAIAGRIEWEDSSTLKFFPDAPLPPATELTIRISGTARAANGKALAEKIELAFQTPDYLRPAQLLPQAGEADIDPSIAVAVSFNQPVIALGSETSQQPAGFTLDPEASGRGEWLNTSTYVFYPQPPLEGGKLYHAQINPELTSNGGSPLDPASSSSLFWAFSTALPRLLTMEPDPSQLILPDAAFTLSFNQAMQRSSIEDHFELNDATGRPVAGSFNWNEESSQVTFQPGELLARDARYTLFLTGDASAAGGSPLGADIAQSYATVGQLTVTKTRPSANQPLDVYSGYSSFTVQFNAPLAKQDLKALFTLQPAIKGHSYYLDWDQESVHLSGFFEASTEYTLSISPQLADRWGQTMGRSQTIRFKTTAARPTLSIPSLQTGTPVLFMPPGVGFLPAQATNLNTLQISSASLELDDFITLAETIYSNKERTQRLPLRTWQQKLSLNPNRNQPIDVPLNRSDEALLPGLYYYQIQSPELRGAGNYAPAPFLLVASRIQLTLKLSTGQLMVWAVNLADSTPLTGASISVYDRRATAIAMGKTDENGISLIELPDLGDQNYGPFYAVIGRPGEAGFALATTNWTDSAAGWNYGLPTELARLKPKIYLYTGRPIYRPGQSVAFRAVVRQPDNGRYHLPTIKQLSFRFLGEYSPQLGSRPVLDTLSLPISEFGTASGVYTLPQDAPPGFYTIEAGSNDPVQINFQVAEYRKPEIDLKVDFTKTEWTAGQDLEAVIDGHYFFGAPAGGLPFTWSLYTSPAYLQAPAGYRTGKETLYLDREDWLFYSSDLGKYISEGSAKLAADGSYRLQLPFSELKEHLDTQALQKLTLEISLQDESGSQVSARQHTRLHPADFYIGVRSETWSGQAGAQMGFAIQTLDQDGRPSGDHSLAARFFKIDWKQEDSYEDVYIRQIVVPEYSLVSSADLQTDASGRARLAFTPQEAGNYLLEVNKDNAITQVMIWVGGAASAAWPRLSNQRIELRADAAEYQAGQTARIFIPNPFDRPAQALVTVERSRVMRSQVITISSASHELSLPLNDEDAPNVFLSVTLLGRQSDGRPDYRQGYLELIVKPETQILQVELASQPEKTSPGDTVRLTLRVKDQEGKPAQGEFSLALVDKAALALADANAPGIQEAFYGRQSLGVISSLSLSAYIRRASYPTPGRGGGGGGAETAAALRERFLDTAFWRGNILTDADGLATIDVALPDNLTTWVANLRGLTRDAKVGEITREIITSKDLLIRPVTPRFLVAGDQVELAAVVHNNTGQKISAEVSLQAAGFSLDPGYQLSQRVELDAGSQRKVTWRGAVQLVDVVDAVFSVRAGGLQDAARPEQGKLPVLRYSTPQTFATTGILENEEERLEVLGLPQSFIPSGGELRLELSPSLAATLIAGLDALEAWPGDFSEGILSRMLPNLQAYRALQELGFEMPSLRNRLQNAVQDSIERLTRLQNQDGGWGWSAGRLSDPYISAYILFGLSQASTAGVLVEPAVIQKAQSFLVSSLAQPEMSAQTHQLDRLVFQHFALKHSGRFDLDSSQLYTYRDRLSPWAVALLAQTISADNPGDQRTAALLASLENSAQRSATGAYWQDKQASRSMPGGPNLNTAIVVFTLAKMQPANDLLVPAVRHLVAHRSPSGGWASSYETAWILLALTEALKGSGDLQASFSFSASLNEALLAQGKAGGIASLTPISVTAPLADLHTNTPNALRIKRGVGSGRLYYRAYLLLDRPVESSPALDRGISITRAYFAAAECDQEACPPIHSIQLSDSTPPVFVRLTLTLSEDLYHLVVEDTIPAGSEILNPLLKTSRKGETQEEQLYDPRNPFASGWGWWYFSAPQIFDEHIRWTSEYLPAGTYELTYRILPLQAGRYQVIPAHAYQYFFPEVEGSSRGESFEILP